MGTSITGFLFFVKRREANTESLVLLQGTGGARATALGMDLLMTFISSFFCDTCEEHLERCSCVLCRLRSSLDVCAQADLIFKGPGDRRRLKDFLDIFSSFWFRWAPSRSGFSERPDLNGSWADFSESFRCFPLAPSVLSFEFKGVEKLDVSDRLRGDPSVDSSSVFGICRIIFPATSFGGAVELDFVGSSDGVAIVWVLQLAFFRSFSCDTPGPGSRDSFVGLCDIPCRSSSSLNLGVGSIAAFEGSRICGGTRRGSRATFPRFLDRDMPCAVSGKDSLVDICDVSCCFFSRLDFGVGFTLSLDVSSI